MTPLHAARGLVRLATPDDDEAIHRLNYRTFVEEIPQHPPNEARTLVDRFHGENCYAVYEVGGRVVGMVAGRTTRPFSLDTKLGGIDRFLSPGCRPAEIRLLAVEPAHRSTRACVALMSFITRHLMDQGFDTGVISGTTRQLRLYEHLGFRAFGPLVGSEGAWYQPMQIGTAEVTAWPDAMPTTAVVNCLPGPVSMRREVQAAFESTPISHRADAFRCALADANALLCGLTGARAATILLGSGTLANDMVAAALVPTGRRGVVATNGEFGDRLVDHAHRAGLDVHVVDTSWGEPLPYERVGRAIAQHAASWLWTVHCETSSGVLNDLDALRALSVQHDCLLALDAISSVGTVPVDLRGVHLASAVSGKALGAFAGLAVVFHDGKPVARPDVPRYLDLAYAHAQGGVPFTHSSNLVAALRAALSREDWNERLSRVASTSHALRTELAARGVPVLAQARHASPAVLTLPISAARSRDVGDALRRRGVLASYESGYLVERNWVQLCLMGEWSEPAMRRVPEIVATTIDRCRTAGQRARSAHARDAERHVPALRGIAAR